MMLLHQLTTLLLLPVLSLSLVIPPRDAEPGCQATSFNNFSWTVRDLHYRASYVFTTPSHQNSHGQIDFSLTNAALDYAAACTASSDQLEDFFYGDVVYACTVPDGRSATTTFAFDRPGGALALNQTWTCSDQDPRFPTRISAYAVKGDLDLSCTDNTVLNRNWTAGQIYSTRTVDCAPQTFELLPDRMDAVA